MPKVVILFTDPSPLWYEGIRYTFILAHHVTPLKGGWVHSISLGHFRSLSRPKCLPQSGHSLRGYCLPNDWQEMQSYVSRARISNHGWLDTRRYPSYTSQV